MKFSVILLKRVESGKEIEILIVNNLLISLRKQNLRNIISMRSIDKNIYVEIEKKISDLSIKKNSKKIISKKKCEKILSKGDKEMLINIKKRKF
jgi:hypothetical protein